VSQITHIAALNVFLHLYTAVIRSSTPTDDETLSFKLLAQKLDKDHRPTSISSITGDNDKVARHRINSSIIGLSLTLICNRKFNPLIAWSPYVATGILPNQMAFIDVQYHDRTIGNTGLVCLHQFTDLFFF